MGIKLSCLTRAARKGHKIEKVTVYVPYPPERGKGEKLGFGKGTKMLAYRIKQEWGKGQVWDGILQARRVSIKEKKMEQMYHEVPSLSRNIAKFLPHQHLTWKEAEKEFEKQFLERLLEENDWNVSKTADKIKIRVETLHRKIKKLRLGKG